MADELLGVVPKTERAEVRVTRTCRKGREIVDLRIWWRPEGAADMVPSRKGFALDTAKVEALCEALQRAAPIR